MNARGTSYIEILRAKSVTQYNVDFITIVLFYMHNYSSVVLGLAAKQ